MTDHSPYVGRVYAALSRSMSLRSLEIGRTATNRWARARLRSPFPKGIRGGSVEWSDDAGWSLLLSVLDEPEQRYWLNRAPVTGVSVVANWALQLVEEVRTSNAGLLFSLVDLHTERVPHTEPPEKVDEELAAYNDPAKRYGGFWANGQLPAEKPQEPETRVAALALTDVMHDFLSRDGIDSGQYAVRGAHEKWKRGTYLGLFIDERAGRDARTITGLGTVAPAGKSGTFERKVEISHYARLSQPVPLELFSDLGKVARDSFDRNRNLTPVAGQKILARLTDRSPEAARRVAWLEEQIRLEEPSTEDRLIRPLERDALGVLFEAFDIEREHLLSWRRESEADPFLTGLAGARKGGRFNPQEKWQVDFDATNFPGWRFHNTDHVAWRRFENKYGSRSLLVANIDRTPAENKTGVDLVYYNPHGGNFVMLQYKTMRQTEEGLYSSIDERFLTQIKRMRELDEKTRDTTPRHPDIRLVDTPCFIKLCAPQTRMSAGTELISGMYFTREHFEILHEHTEDLGHSTGKRIRQASIPRYLTGTDFISLMSNGWLGSRGTGTEQLYEQLDLSLAEGRSVMLGTHTDGLPLMNHSSGQWQENF